MTLRNVSSSAALSRVFFWVGPSFLLSEPRNERFSDLIITSSSSQIQLQWLQTIDFHLFFISIKKGERAFMSELGNGSVCRVRTAATDRGWPTHPPRHQICNQLRRSITPSMDRSNFLARFAFCWLISCDAIMAASASPVSLIIGLIRFNRWRAIRHVLRLQRRPGIIQRVGMLSQQIFHQIPRIPHIYSVVLGVRGTIWNGWFGWVRATKESWVEVKYNAFNQSF